MSQQAMRFYELDLLRGVACAAVVAFHYLSRSPRIEWMPQAIFPSLDAVARYGYLGVHLFFVISGFVILLSAQGATPREFVASRIARLYPALWVAATITAGAAWWLEDSRFSISLPHLLANLAMVPHWFGVPYVDGAYWSLAVELHFYIYVWITLRLKMMHRVEWLFMAWMLVSVLNAVRPVWPAEFWLNAKWAPLFVAGGIFFLIRTQGCTRQRAGMLVLSYSLALVYALREVATAANSSTPSLANPLIVAGIITTIYAIFLLVAFGRWTMPPSRLTALAAALTYPVYVIHQCFGAMLYQQLLFLIANPALVMTMTTILIGLLGWAIHRYVEKKIGPKLRKWI